MAIFSPNPDRLLHFRGESGSAESNIARAIHLIIEHSFDRQDNYSHIYPKKLHFGLKVGDEFTPATMS